jgi:phosphate transport system substrate-binding protein
MNNDMAVSPIVATLVLIVVAVIGAVAVGTIMGTFSSDVSKQASAADAATGSGQQILIAGSTTCIPAELNLQTDYQRVNPGTQINVQGGGSSEGPEAVALGIADIGAVSSSSTITNAIADNPTNPIYQNLYFTQIGGRGVVFIQDASLTAVPTNIVDQADLNTAYDSAAANSGKTSAAITGTVSVYVNGQTETVGGIAAKTTMEQREAGSGTMSTAFNWIGGDAKNNASNGFTGLPSNNGNAAMLTAVQAGSSSSPIIGFVDSGYAITGGVSSNTTASGISIMGVAAKNATGIYAAYLPTHANIKAALKDWYYGNAQDTSTGTGIINGQGIAGQNYPQALVGGLYWITKGSVGSAFNGNQIGTVGISAASSPVTALISFAKSPSEAQAFNNAGVYSMYDFMQS